MNLVVLRQRLRLAGLNMRAVRAIAPSLREDAKDLQAAATKTEQGAEIEATDIVIRMLAHLRAVLKALGYENTAMRLDPLLGSLEKDVAAARTEAIENFVDEQGPAASVRAALNPGAKLGDLTREQQIVIWATFGFNPSYPPVGKHIRFYEAWEATGITLEEWRTAQKELISHKVLASNGALTPQAKQLIKMVRDPAQSALRHLAKPGWNRPSPEDRGAMEDRLNATT